MKALVRTDGKPWERQDGETDLAYSAFCKYLELPKRGEGNRRIVEDLVKQHQFKATSVQKWSIRHQWPLRAAAYDESITYRSVNMEEEIKARREFVKEIHDAAKKFRKIAQKALTRVSPDEIAPKEAVAIYKLGVELEKEAQKLEQPDVEEKQRELRSEIGKLVGAITAKLGGTVGTGAGGAISATERTIRFDLGADNAGCNSVPQVSELPGEVRE